MIFSAKDALWDLRKNTQVLGLSKLLPSYIIKLNIYAEYYRLTYLLMFLYEREAALE